MYGIYLYDAGFLHIAPEFMILGFLKPAAASPPPKVFRKSNVSQDHPLHMLSHSFKLGLQSRTSSAPAIVASVVNLLKLRKIV